MLEDLINADIPLIFVETDEPERIVYPETDKILGLWDKKGIKYRIGCSLERIASTSSMESALEYLSKTSKKFLIFFMGEPDYDLLNEIPDYHTLVFVNSKFDDYAGAVRISLPLPTEDEYLKAFKDKTKFAKECAKYSIGMKLRDALNCYKYSKHTKTDFLKNKTMFSKSIYLDIVTSKNTFKNLGGFSDFKKWFNERKFWYKTEGFPKQKGVLLSGPSGVGKSLCASCLGNEAELPLYRFDITRVYDQYVGKSEEKIRQALKAIEQASPCVIWIEEIGRLFSGQANVAHNQVLAILLEWMQEHNKDIFIVATANNTEDIPTEMTRPGRFNLKYKADYPTREERLEILNLYMDFKDKEYFLDRTVRWTGAMIWDLVQNATIKTLNENKTKEEAITEILGE